MKSVGRNFVLGAGLLFCSGVMAVPAMAAQITYDFTGTVTGLGASLTRPANPAPFNTGALSAMSGTMVVDTTDNNPGNLNRGEYNILSLDVMIGNYNLLVGPSGTVVIRNGNGGGAEADRFLVQGVNAAGNDPVRFFNPRLFTINLRGPNGAYTGADELPNPAPSIGSFPVNGFRLQFGPGNANNRAVTGVLNTLTAVPLPAGVVLFGLGLVALIGLGTGGLRNIRAPQI